MPYSFYNGPVGIQTVGAIVLSVGELTNDMLAVQIVTPGFQLSCTTLGELKAYINGSTGLYNDGGVLAIAGNPGWPTDSSGTPGSLWSNGGVVSVVPGGVPVPAPPVIFGFISAQALLELGGLGLPTTSPPMGSQQLWNLGGEVLIA